MSEERGQGEEQPPLPRSDRDWVGPLGGKVGNPDRACLTCLVLIVVAVLVFIGCAFYYYRNNAAFHAP